MGIGYYNHKGELNGDSLEYIKHRKIKNSGYELIVAPPQTDLQDWLRIEHKIHIQIIYMDDVLKYGFKLTDIDKNIHYDEVFINNSINGGWEYEEALEHGLQKSLKIL